MAEKAFDVTWRYNGRGETDEFKAETEEAARDAVKDRLIKRHGEKEFDPEKLFFLEVSPAD